ncbi:MAG: hypothetical protein GY706_05550, partial [Bacteroides sp.]|nr:hypothetical protein [Bacteroides sp.]
LPVNTTPSKPTSVVGHRNISDVFASPYSRNASIHIDSIFEEATAYEGIHTILLSDENLSHPDFVLSNTAYKFLSDYFEDIKIVVYVRRQDNWAESFYKEAIVWPKNTEEREFQDYFNDQLTNWLDYEGRLSKWEIVFGTGNIIVRSYDDDGRHNIVEDFYRTLELEGCITDQISRDIVNPSLPNNLVPLLISINQLGLPYESKSRITNSIFRLLVKEGENLRKASLLPDEFRASIKNIF